MKKILTGLTIATITLTSCGTGQIDPPTPTEVLDGIEWIYVTNPDGEQVRCLMYAARGSGVYGESPAWFDLDCDWDSVKP